MYRSEIRDLSGKNSKGFYCTRFKIVEVKKSTGAKPDKSINETKKPLCVRSGRGLGGLPGECKCYKCKEVYENFGGTSVVLNNDDDLSDESCSN